MPSPAPPSRRPAAYALAAAGILLVVHVLLKVATRGDRVVDDVAQLAAAGLAALACAWRAVRSCGPQRRAWAALATGCAAWAAGQGTWTVYELVLHRDTPFPSVADAFYLLLPVCAVAAIVLFPTGRPRQRGRDVLDGAILATTLLTVAWTTGLGPALASGEGPWTTAVSLAYPLSDVGLVTMALLGLSRARRHRTPLLVIAAGLTAMATADALFTYETARGTYTTGSWTSTGWVTAFLLLAAAPLTARRPAPDDAPVRRSDPWQLVALPYAPLSLTLVAAAVDVLRDGHVERTAGGLLLAAVSLTLVRQHVTLRDNRALLRRVASQQSALEHQAFHDPLTGLPNRARFVTALETALGAPEPVIGPEPDDVTRPQRRVAVLFCDLDGFKGVNDGLGHAAGDRLLAEIAARLRSAVGAAGLVARLGGDEFAVLLDDPYADALEVAQRLRDAADEAFTVDDRVVRLGASVGVATARPGPEAPSADMLLSQADVAMYTSKRSTGRRPVAWSPGLALPEAQDWRILPALEHALATGTLEAHYQPVVALRTGEVQGYEALARWPHARDALSPADFLPVAARNGLMRPLTLHMLSTAARQHARWLAALAAAGVEAPGQGLRMSVNVSPADFVDPAFPHLVAPLVAGLALPRGALVVEVTEDALLTDVTAATRNARALHDLGLLVALDDFGAGYSALAHLTELPLDVLKLDRRFVRDADSSAAARTLLRGVVGLARDLGLAVVAEGVERETQAEVLRDLGCPLAQGFLYAPARSAAFVDPVEALSRR